MFVVLTLLLSLGAHWYLQKITVTRKGFPKWAWIALSLLILGGCFFSERTGLDEKRRLQKMLQGFAPTYAAEMRRLNHASLSPSTDSADPVYLTLIGAEKEWLKVNPVVNDIYTFGMLPDARIVLMVDSETDYDHNGAYEGPREQRTPIGEIYEEVGSEIREAFHGKSSFAGDPYTDRWGKWVSAFEPIFDKNGNVCAVLGVDYSASEWVASIFRSRMAALGYTGIIILMMLAYLLMQALLRSSIDRTRRSSDILKESQKHFKLLSEAAPVGIYRTDRAGRCTYTNPFWQRLAGLLFEESLGEGWNSTLHPDDRAEVLSIWNQAVAKGRIFQKEFRFKAPDGRITWVDSRAHTVTDPDNTVSGYIGMVQDITEKKKIEAQLIQSQKMETVGTLAGGIAHDLNNQITPVVGYIDLLLSDLPTDHPSRPLVVEASSAAKRCTEIVQRLLNFSRPSTQKQTLIQTEKLFKETESLLKKFLPATILLEILPDKNLPTLLGNETEIQSVLINLAANARDAMPKGGKFRVLARREILAKDNSRGLCAGSYLHIEVSDTGAGIPPEVMHKIFEPFFTTKPKGHGTGLGLAMVFSIIKNHNGWIDVRSAAGKGTTFDVFLPAHETESGLSDPTPLSPEAVNPAPPPLGQQETILVAEDEAPLRNMVAALLERLNYKVILVSNGEEAVAAYIRHSRDIAIVLMDMTMPRMTGRQIIQEILQWNPKAKIIAVSGYTSEGSVEELKRAGVMDFIQKPYTIESLAHSLHAVIH